MQNPEFTNWHKSAHSEDSGCVEIAAADDLVAIRDSKHPNGPILTFTRREWTAFTTGIADGTLTPER